MTGTEVALIIASTGTLVTAVGGCFVALRNKLDKIQTQTDGMHKEVVREVREAAALLAEVALATADKKANAAYDAGVVKGIERS